MHYDAVCVSWQGKGSGLVAPGFTSYFKRENLVINHKRTERIYHEEGLALRRKRRRKGVAGVRVVIPTAVKPNEQWSMDFVSDSIVTGRRFRP
jgi:putative transposase